MSHSLAAQVAGSFYPADREALTALIARMQAKARPAGLSAKVAVVPHAGISWSGDVAASAIASLAVRPVPVSRVVLIGPAHRYGFSGIATHGAEQFLTPLGAVASEAAAARAAPGVTVLPDAFAGEHALELPLVMLQALLPRPFRIVPFITGAGDAESAAAVLRHVWGGPETAIVVSSDLSHFLTQAEAEARDRATAVAVETLAHERIGSADACGHRALAAALLLARQHDMRVTALHLSTSAAQGGDTGRVVGYGAFGMEYAASAQTNEASRALLLATVMASIAQAVTNAGKQPVLRAHAPLAPDLMARRATFVTIEKDGRLRGCIGSLAPQRPLIADVAVNAVKAGFADPRFSALKEEDLDGLKLSVAILSHRRPIAATNEDELIQALEPDRDGLVIEDQGRSALFLPSVWKGIPEPRDFVRQLKIKAGLAAGHWSASFKAYRFRSENFAAPFRTVTPGEIAPVTVVAS